MATQTDYRPTFPEEQEERVAERKRRDIAAAIERREDLIWLLSGRRGRRKVRRQLREAGFDVASDDASTVLDRHHGQMCFNEGLRTEALRVLWPLMRLAASGELPFDSFAKLFTENDDR